MATVKNEGIPKKKKNRYFDFFSFDPEKHSMMSA